MPRVTRKPTRSSAERADTQARRLVNPRTRRAERRDLGYRARSPWKAASSEEPIEFEGIRERFLPECGCAHPGPASAPQVRVAAVAAMLRAGVDPGRLDEIIWRQSDDLWVRALDSARGLRAVAADRTGVPSWLCEHFLNP